MQVASVAGHLNGVQNSYNKFLASDNTMIEKS
jgi:hypothetical protein